MRAREHVGQCTPAAGMRHCSQVMELQRAETVTVDPGGRTLPSAGTSANPGTCELEIGAMLKGSYRIERKLGEGGMGAVYLAEHVAIRKKVAVKVLGLAHAQRPDLKQRFLREARAAAAIAHDHVIEIHDFGETPEGSAFFVMEYLQGVDLAALLEREGRLPWPRARDIMLQVCSALEAAHALGTVHRDMKPANCFVLARAGQDFIKVLDFGVAKVQDLDDGVGQAITRAGSIFGTPEYMSPEQARGEAHDRRVDVYSAGVILFHMLVGRVPFVADTFMGLLHQHMYEAPPRPSELAPDAGISAEVEAVVLRALQKDPAHRFQSMAEMAAALRAVDTGAMSRLAGGSHWALRRGPTTYRSAPFAGLRRLALASTVLLAVGGLSAAWLLRDAPGPDGLVVLEPPPPAPSPGVVVVPPGATSPARDLVHLHIDTGGVAAEVFDEHETQLGTTADPAGLALARGSGERVLSLRAEGFEARRVRVVPEHDLQVSAPLVRRQDLARVHKAPPRASEPMPPAPASEPGPPGLPEPPKPPGTITSPDLIKPFPRR